MIEPQMAEALAVLGAAFPEIAVQAPSRNLDGPGWLRRQVGGRVADDPDKVTVAGIVVSRPDLAYTAEGHAVTKFALKTEQPNLLNVTAWRDLAESVADLAIGQSVVVTGILRPGGIFEAETAGAP